MLGLLQEVTCSLAYIQNYSLRNEDSSALRGEKKGIDAVSSRGVQPDAVFVDVFSSDRANRTLCGRRCHTGVWAK